jgi:hypothetical protein
MNLKFSIQSKYFSLWVLLLVSILSFLREPKFFIAPRLWAEEGMIYLQSALNIGILESIFLPHLGYYSLVNNITVALGLSLVGLTNIAYFTTWTSFAFILMTVLAPLALPSHLWDSKIKQFLLVITTLIIGSPEIWLNTINLQFFLCVFGCFVLLSDTSSLRGWRLYYVIFMMFNGALTGITTIALAPFFLYKFWKANLKPTADKLILGILGIGIITQLGALVYFANHGGVSRFSFNNLHNFPSGIIATYLSTFPFNRTLGAIFLISYTALLIPLRAFNQKLNMILILALYLCVLFTFLSLNMQGGWRYGYPCAVLIFIYLMNAIQLNRSKFDLLLWILTGIFLTLASMKFFRTTIAYDHNWATYSIEKIVIEADGSKSIKLFPQWEGTNWRLQLNDAQLERYK